MAFVADIGTDEHDAAAVSVGTGGCLEEGATLDHDIAVFGACGEGSGNEGGSAIGPAGNIEAREEELGIFVIEEAVFNEVVVDRKGGGDEGAGIDLGTGAEDDTVLIDDVDLALGVDFASDLGGGCAAYNFVEGDPFAGVGSAGGLVEVDGGLAADIEGFPVEEGLGGGLFDVDGVARGGHGIGAFPFRVCACEDFETAFGEAVGDCVGCGCGAGGGLEGAHVVDGLCGAGEAVLGADFGGFGCGGTSVGAGFGVSLGVAGTASGTEHVAGLESTGGHGGEEGGEEGACENGTRTPTRCEELEGAEVVACSVADFQHGAEIFDRINRIGAERRRTAKGSP